MGVRRTAASVSSRATIQSHRAIETEIIPRLMMIHRQGNLTVKCRCQETDGQPAHDHLNRAKEGSDTSPECEPSALAKQSIDDVGQRSPSQWAISGLSDFLLDLEPGLSAEDVLFDVLTPVARRLGEDWVQDVRDFTDVTVGVGTLQHVMRSLRSLDAPIWFRKRKLGVAVLSDTRGPAHLWPVDGRDPFQLGMVCSVRTNLDEHGIDAALKGDDFLALSLVRKPSQSIAKRNSDSARSFP